MAARPKVAAIVVAYNEAETIGGVIRPMVQAHLFDEIIVISDGSTDQTALRARQAGATLVHELPIKGGKGQAMLHGLTHTDAPILFFADADLIGLRPEHLAAILEPVLSGKKMMNVGLRDRGKFLTLLAAHLPLIGGERALARHVISSVDPKFLQGFMIESTLNYHCRKEKLAYGSVSCPGLKIKRKMEKVGFWSGFKEYLRMYFQVIKAMILVRIVKFEK